MNAQDIAPAMKDLLLLLASALPATLPSARTTPSGPPASHCSLSFFFFFF